MTRQILSLLLCAASCLYGIVRGGLPERIAGILLAAAYVLSILFQNASPGRFLGVDWGVYSVDMLLLVCLVYLACVAQRFWPLWMSAMQAISVLSHLPTAIKAGVLPWAYWKAISLWSYPMLLLLIAATHWHQQRIKLNGADPSWKTF
jgi:hypothetical protein